MRHEQKKSGKPCDCPKRAYYNLEEAEENRDYQMQDGAPALEVYRCPDNPYIWHLSRLLGDEW
jgi:hypothetical protein